MKSIIEFKKQAKILSKEKNVKIKEALETISKQNGFSEWKKFRDSLDTFWYEKSSPFLTKWFTTYADALEHKSDKGGFLLTYKGQYFIVDADYVEFLGIDPRAEIWRNIDNDVSSANAFDKMYEYLKENHSNLLN